MFMGFFEKFRQKKDQLGGETRPNIEAEKEQRWKAAQQKLEEARGTDVWGGSLQVTPPVMGRPHDDPDPYDREMQRNLERLAMCLPVKEGSITPSSVNRKDIVNPNTMGDARISNPAFAEEEKATPLVDPQIDAYMQNMMAQEEVAKQAEGQDRKPVAEN